MTDEHAFHVLRDGEVVLRTDDWVEACTAALAPWPHGVRFMQVLGVHPSHRWERNPGKQRDSQRCLNCGKPNNGSYGSQSPCGYDWSYDSLASALERERDERASDCATPDAALHGKAHSA